MILYFEAVFSPQLIIMLTGLTHLGKQDVDYKLETWPTTLKVISQNRFCIYNYEANMANKGLTASMLIFLRYLI